MIDKDVKDMSADDIMKMFMGGASKNNELSILADKLMDISKKAHNIAIGKLK